MFPFTRTVLIFFIVGLLFLCASSASNLGSVPHPAETGLLIPSGKRPNRTGGNHRKPDVWSRDVARWVRFGLSVAGPFVCRCLTIRTMLRFHIPLIEPDVRICRIRLSEKTHTIAVAIACDPVCNF